MSNGFSVCIHGKKYVVSLHLIFSWVNYQFIHLEETEGSVMSQTAVGSVLRLTHTCMSDEGLPHSESSLGTDHHLKRDLFLQ